MQENERHLFDQLARRWPESNEATYIAIISMNHLRPHSKSHEHQSHEHQSERVASERKKMNKTSLIQTILSYIFPHDYRGNLFLGLKSLTDRYLLLGYRATGYFAMPVYTHQRCNQLQHCSIALKSLCYVWVMLWSVCGCHWLVLNVEEKVALEWVKFSNLNNGNNNHYNSNVYLPQ